jgi:hypothetical protein
MISDGAAEAIKEDNAMSVFFMDFDMAPPVIWARDLYDQMQIRSDFRKWFPRMCQYGFVVLSKQHQTPTVPDTGGAVSPKTERNFFLHWCIM